MKLVIKDRKSFPACIRHFKELKGICVGGCSRRGAGDLPVGVMAHAHTTHRRSHQGWICLRYKYQLKERHTLLHEVAHLLVPHKIYHGKVWRDMVVKIGGTIEPFRSLSRREKKVWLYPGYTTWGRTYYSDQELEGLQIASKLYRLSSAIRKKGDKSNGV